MTRHARGVALGVVSALALGILVASAVRSNSALFADEDDVKAIMEAQDAVVKMTQAKDGDVEKQAKALADKAGPDGLVNIMTVFKPRNKRGIGIGPKGDAMEQKIILLAKRSLTKGDLAKQQDELIKMAEVSRVLAEVAQYYTPKEKKADKDPADWRKYNDDMKKGANELIAAVKSGDPKAVKTAANNLNASCTDCHSKFRD